jgi:hypothetical protein
MSNDLVAFKSWLDAYAQAWENRNLRYVGTSDIQASEAAGATIRTGNAGSYRFCRVPVPALVYYAQLSPVSNPELTSLNAHR